MDVCDEEKALWLAQADQHRAQAEAIRAHTASSHPQAESANLGLATNEELENELRTRVNMGNAHPEYRTVDHD